MQYFISPNFGDPPSETTIDLQKMQQPVILSNILKIKYMYSESKFQDIIE